jgi:3-oxoacyl-(acyl-carrier-protein) synthase
LLNGIAWIQSGMAGKFLVGGSESPLTPFTIAQMKALKIYAGDQAGNQKGQAYPCRSLDLEKTTNSMILGEGASVACLEKGVVEGALAVIEGVGYATEPLEHSVSLSTDAVCFQRSMQMALQQGATADIDVIVMHAPGTIKGDKAEWNAIQKVFGQHVPAVTGNKWKLGHTFATSGMLSLEMALLMLQHQKFVPVPFIEYARTPKTINRVMVNAVGFGGNAVSVLLAYPPV